MWIMFFIKIFLLILMYCGPALPEGCLCVLFSMLLPPSWFAFPAEKLNKSIIHTSNVGCGMCGMRHATHMARAAMAHKTK